MQGAPFNGLVYRVKTEESGTVLLDMIVCHPCRIEAQQLGLYTEEIPLHSMLNASSEMKKV